MNTIINAVSERLELPVDLLESDETVSQLVSLLQKQGRENKTIEDILVVYLSAVRENLKRI